MHVIGAKDKERTIKGSRVGDKHWKKSEWLKEWGTKDADTICSSELRDSGEDQLGDKGYKLKTERDEGGGTVEKAFGVCGFELKKVFGTNPGDGKGRWRALF